MKVWRICIIATCIMGIMICLSSPSIGAEMEWDIKKKVDTKSPALDMAMSMDGKRMFLLDKNGNLNVYSIDGKLEGTAAVGKGFDNILPTVDPDILLLSNRKQNSVQELTLNFVYDIDIEGSPFKGPEDAPIIISVFSDFQCPYCARIGGIMDKVLKEFPKEVKLVFKNFPLRNHQYALDAAKAALAAHKMGKFWEFHDLLFKNYNKLNKEKIDEIREELKLDKKEFDKHVNDPAIMSMIRKDYKGGINAGVRGTPAVYVNGKQFRNTSPGTLKEIINKELKKK
jgi:predicted DsbA family dithiol-disulfide isomerase